MSENIWAMLIIGAQISALIINALTHQTLKKSMDLIQRKAVLIFNNYLIYFIAALIFIAVATFFVSNVDYGESGNISSFGQTGDFFGGILNPLLTFCTLFLLVKTLNHDSEKTKQDRIDVQEMNHQRKIDRLEDAIKKSRSIVSDKMEFSEAFPWPRDKPTQELTYLGYFNAMRTNKKTDELKRLLAISHKYAHKIFDIDIEKIAAEYDVDTRSFYEIALLKQDIDRIIQCYILQIGLLKEAIFKHQTAADARTYAAVHQRVGLFPSQECDRLMQVIDQLLEGTDPTEPI